MDLHPHEVRILKALECEASPVEVAGKAGISVDAVQRASSWLATKKLVEVEETVIEEVSLGEEGLEYLKSGLPERLILEKADKKTTIEELEKKLKGVLDIQQINIGLGWLRKKGQAAFMPDGIMILNNVKTSDEQMLEKIGEGTVKVNDLDDGEKNALELLRKRKNVVEVSSVKEILLAPTVEGMKLAASLEVDESISLITPELIKSGRWRDRRIRPYDPTIYVKPEYPAKKHPLQREIELIRSIFVQMGFSELRGDYVESSLWNFDALFTAQDHPVRDMHDTFYLKHPKKVEIPGYEKHRDNVRRTHEDGWTTGSTGWGYEWDEREALKPVLRTHTTGLTCRHLSGLKREDLPVKVFSIGKVFRNEAVDYKHLPEFFQIEGIVADTSVNFRNLLGILDEFYTKMGFKVRFRPAYFPYTEMSVEPEVYFEEKGEWIELGGSGMFRPEVVKPILGFDCPVLAWGLGLDRVVALKLGLKDIRQLYLSDLDWLKSM